MQTLITMETLHQCEMTPYPEMLSFRMPLTAGQLYVLLQWEGKLLSQHSARPHREVAEMGGVKWVWSGMGSGALCPGPSQLCSTSCHLKEEWCTYTAHQESTSEYTDHVPLGTEHSLISFYRAGYKKWPDYICNRSTVPFPLHVVTFFSLPRQSLGRVCHSKPANYSIPFCNDFYAWRELYAWTNFEIYS